MNLKRLLLEGFKIAKSFRYKQNVIVYYDILHPIVQTGHNLKIYMTRIKWL